MVNKELFKRAGQLGLPLLEIEDQLNVNQTLADVVKSDNVRLLEGFPLLLTNAAKRPDFSLNKVEALLTNRKDKLKLKELELLSLAVYKFLKLHFDWANKLNKGLSQKETVLVKKHEDLLKKGHNFNFMDHVFSPSRLTDVFSNYFKSETEAVKQDVDKQESLSLEYALSQVFSPKQKELFLKRVKGVNLTKTEREYFSRTVKKKLFALANPELNRFAKLLLGF